MADTSSPSISSISPSSPTASSSNQNVTVFGSQFQSGLTVSVTFPGGRGTTLSGAQIQNVTSGSFRMVITLNAAGIWGIKANNPDGGQSNTFNFRVQQGTSSRGFLGAGVAFPLAVDAQGRIAMNSLEDHVRQSILLILQTAKGERVMRSDFGAGLQTLVFSPISAATAALVQHEVKDALVRFEPRIDVLEVTVTVDPTRQGLLLIDLQYRVRRTDTTFNLVYPFFLERGAL